MEQAADGRVGRRLDSDACEAGHAQAPRSGAAFLSAYPLHRGGTRFAASAPRSLRDRLSGQIAFAQDLKEQVAFLDARWNIIAVNRAWIAAANAAGIKRATGFNYLDFCAQKSAEGSEAAALVLTALQEMAAGTRSEFEHIYMRGDIPLGPVFHIQISMSELDGERFATLIRYDLTELLKLKRQRQRLGRRLLRAQQDERRRVARELHDATAQELVALQLSLARLKARGGAPPDAYRDVDESLDSVQRSIRSLSFINHPPAVASGGLAPALKAMACGFAQRTGLSIGLRIDETAELAPPVEAAFYRLTQEALANVHRHAQATSISIDLVAKRRWLHLLIRDDGIGFPRGRAGKRARHGVGIESMRERIDELGGRMSITSVCGGTTIVASVPHPAN